MDSTGVAAGPAGDAASAHEPGGIAFPDREPDSRRIAPLQRQLETVDHLEEQIEACEQSLETMLAPNAERDLLKTLPGVGPMLSAVIALEIGDIAQFGNARNLGSYAGLVPAARESAGKKRRGNVPPICNTYLKWALLRPPT